MTLYCVTSEWYGLSAPRRQILSSFFVSHWHVTFCELERRLLEICVSSVKTQRKLQNVKILRWQVVCLFIVFLQIEGIASDVTSLWITPFFPAWTHGVSACLRRCGAFSCCFCNAFLKNLKNITETDLVLWEMWWSCCVHEAWKAPDLLDGMKMKRLGSEYELYCS